MPQRNRILRAGHVRAPHVIVMKQISFRDELPMRIFAFWRTLSTPLLVLKVVRLITPLESNPGRNSKLSMTRQKDLECIVQ